MALSSAGAGHLDPLLYPWDPPVASGVMDGNEIRALGLSVGLDEALAQASAAPLEARSLVVSIGSNSSADVMRRKFANYPQPASAVLPLVRGSSTTSPLATAYQFRAHHGRHRILVVHLDVVDPVAVHVVGEDHT